MAGGCMAPECTLGMGAAAKCAVWHDVTAGDGARASRHRLPPRLAAFLEARPARPHLWARGGSREDKNIKSIRVANEAPSQLTHLRRSRRGGGAL